MRRPGALLALLALSWSQLVALRCDMGAGGHAGTHHESIPVADEAAHVSQEGGHAAGHGDKHGCLMVLACGTASIRATRSLGMIRMPALFVRAAFLPRPVPAAADLAVETPPPRHSV